MVERFHRRILHGNNGFVTATKLGTRNELFVASTKNFAAATTISRTDTSILAML